MNQSAMMMLLSGLVGLLLVLTAEARVGYSSESYLCYETEQCLHFDLICQTEDFEVRHIESVNWVSTHEMDYSIDTAALKGFKRLYKYINGANQNGTTMDIVTPVVVRVPQKTSWEMGVYIVHLLLPAEYQDNPPTPTDDNVYILRSPDMNLYIRSYDGWLTAKSDNDTAQSLASDLDSVGANYKKNFHFANTYSSPLSLTSRRSEVMFVDLGEPVCI
ncbi:heme-binding protein 2-like [Hippoglossus stenolepis]|uniref:heme-binding protein 2-like n=1 Tax=Hippoglossus stenolepis TaxID=195615 RepID=UPI00159C3909|nr:heme-binding protein 2-like [Hippoglossus stenolepis]